MATDYTPLSPQSLAALPGVQEVDVVGGILVVLLTDDSSMAVTSAALAEELGLEKWSALFGEDQVFLCPLPRCLTSSRGLLQQHPQTVKGNHEGTRRYEYRAARAEHMRRVRIAEIGR